MEEQILSLIAKDRLHVPLSSLDQKLKRSKNKEAKDIASTLGKARYAGERFYAFVDSEDKEKARGMKEALVEFASEFPKYGAILAGKIAEKRTFAEEHLYFGVNEGKRLTADDYMQVMSSLGLSETTARNLYPDLMEVSRKLSKARNEDRSIIVGKYSESDE